MIYLKVNFDDRYTSVCESKEEVMISCGYESDEMTWEEFLETVKGEYEIIEVEGRVEFLND